MEIILATTSKPRQEIFNTLGLKFISQGANIDERFLGRSERPQELVLQLAKLKAEDVAKSHQKSIVIGFDTAGWYDGKILEKPLTKEEGYNRLKLLSGTKHFLYTGIHMINTTSEKTSSRVVETETLMRNLNDEEIRIFLEQSDVFSKMALGYDPKSGLSATFVKKITGNYQSFIFGVPLAEIIEMLPEVGHNQFTQNN